MISWIWVVLCCDMNVLKLGVDVCVDCFRSMISLKGVINNVLEFKMIIWGWDLGVL